MSRSSVCAEALALWKEWRDTDITEDDDRWASFTDRVYAMLERAEGASPGTGRSRPPSAPSVASRKTPGEPR
jgi:hypothetical protein